PLLLCCGTILLQLFLLTHCAIQPGLVVIVTALNHRIGFVITALSDQLRNIIPFTGSIFLEVIKALLLKSLGDLSKAVEAINKHTVPFPYSTQSTEVTRRINRAPGNCLSHITAS